MQSYIPSMLASQDPTTLGQVTRPLSLPYRARLFKLGSQRMLSAWQAGTTLAVVRLPGWGPAALETDKVDHERYKLTNSAMWSENTSR